MSTPMSREAFEARCEELRRWHAELSERMISRPTGENARKMENTGNGIRTTVSAENLSVAMEGVSISEEEPAGTESR